MSLALREHDERLDPLPAALRDVLDAAWPDAVRSLDRDALAAYADGCLALHRLGRGEAPVLAWIGAAPGVAREVGSAPVRELAARALALGSKTSGAVIERLLATAPVAAQRLGDAVLFLDYLRFIDTLVAQVPRGVRPLLENLETLLRQLTLGGLRRWALWGAQAFRYDPAAQAAYFSLQSRESLAMLQQERKGTLLVDVQRRIAMYLRALWGRDFHLRPTSGDHEQREGYRPFIEDGLLHLPDALDDFDPGDGLAPIAGVELYRAAAAHCAAHLAETREPLSAEALDPLQRALVGAIEDARVEALSIRRLPGLKALWLPFHHARPARAPGVGAHLDRLAHALLDPDHADADPWIAEARALFAAASDALDSNRVSLEIGLRLAHGLRPRRLGFDPRRDVCALPYRDDNRYAWDFSGVDGLTGMRAAPGPRQIRRRASLMEFVNELDTETAGDDAQEIWVLGSELFPYEDMGRSYNEVEGREQPPEPVHYPEWDYTLQLERPAWATVLERRPPRGDAALIDALVRKHRPLVSRMKRVLDAMQPQGLRRQRKLEDGDEIDLDAALHALADLRLGTTPDPRIMMRSTRRTRDTAITVLLDLSESTNDKLAMQDFTVLELTREACALLADAIAKVGDPFAIHGFCSDGREEVDYYRLKDFCDPWGEPGKSRLAGIAGRHSTRLGAAIRHAADDLRRRPESRRLLLVVTDGEPADIDVRDPQYLQHDAKKAVEAAQRKGVRSFCLTLDPRADQYVARIFGQRNYRILDHVERLPEQLPLLYAGLTR